MTDYFIQAFIYLGAAVITVPIAKKLGLGSVLGYLVAGVLIGPMTGLVGQEAMTLQHFAEFGVVMMLFLVGLELEPHMLWQMRHRLLGLGGSQVALTTFAIMLIALLFDLHWTTALVVGFILALSSTAIILQTFNEKGLNTTEGARTAFTTLLFQDIAVIPILALIPLLALPANLYEVDLHHTEASSGGIEHGTASFIQELSALSYAAVVITVIIFVIVIGHYFSRPLFRYVASSGLREIFTVTALALVIGTATLMNIVGLSPALGTFLAGVVLANSEFRHELASNIEPFKGLLLGLFFITVGANINLAILQQHLILISGLVVAIMFVKALILFLLAKLFDIKHSDRWLYTLSLAQAGEFGFVLLSYSQQNQVLSVELGQILSLIVAGSMFLTPGLFIVFDKWILPRYQRHRNTKNTEEINESGTVIIAGIGRFGQIVNRLLVANGIKTVVLDHEITQVDSMRRVNIKSYFGDATQPNLLKKAGIEHAKLLIVTVDNRERTNKLVEYVKQAYPKVFILARAYDRGHSYELKKSGADFIISETYYSALEIGEHALVRLGFDTQRAKQQKATFVATEEAYKEEMYQSWVKDSDGKYNPHHRELFLQLEATLGKVMRIDREY